MAFRSLADASDAARWRCLRDRAWLLILIGLTMLALSPLAGAMIFLLLGHDD